MKKTTLAILVAMASIRYSSAQTTPFGFTRPTVLDLQKKSSLRGQAVSSKPDDKGKPKNNTSILAKHAQYDTLIKKQQKVVDELQKKVDDKYKKDIESLEPAKTPSEQKALENKIEAIEVEKTAGYKEIEILKKTVEKMTKLPGAPEQFAITDRERYEGKRDEQLAVARLKYKKAEEDYDTEMKNMGVVLQSSQEDEKKAKRKQIEDKRLVDLEEVKHLEKLAGQWDYLSRTSNRFNWFFVRNAIDAEMYYNGKLANTKEKFLSNSQLTFSSDGGKASIYNELYADYFGPVRFGFGALISNKQGSGTTASADEKKEDAVQRLLGGGGNGVINISYPLLNYEVLGGLNFKTIIAPKFAIDVPKIGTDNDKYAFSYSPGIEGSIFYTGALKVLTFYSNYRFGITGGNDLFYQNLNKTDKTSFAFNQVSLGMAITSSFRLSYNKFFGSTFVNDNFPGSFSFVFIPN